MPRGLASGPRASGAIECAGSIQAGGSTRFRRRRDGVTTVLVQIGKLIRVIQSKTKARVWIKCHKDLKPYLETAIAEARAAGVANGAFLRGVRGEPMGERYFATRWDAVASRTRTLHLNRQDLRRTAVMRLAEADCTVPQIAAITGHSLKQVEGIMETYFVRTYEMGAAAITKLEVHQDRLKDERN